jgi:PAS domain S-box-containing protein
LKSTNDVPTSDTPHIAAQAERAGRALRDSEGYFRSLVQSASDIILILDRNGSTRYISPSVEWVLGRRPDELVDNQEGDFNLVHPDDISRLQSAIAESLNQPGTAVTNEMRLLHADGSWRHMESILLDALDDQLVGGIIVNLKDVTERKRAEEALQESHRRVENILESINDVSYAVDREWRFTYINERALRRFRRVKGEEITREELMGKNMWEVFPEVVGSVLYQKYHEALSQQEPAQLEVHSPYFPDEWFVMHLYPSEEGLSIYHQDVTEQKQAQEQLAYQAHLLEKMQDAVLATDEQFVLTSWNKGAEKMYGWTADEVLGRKVYEVIPTELGNEQMAQVLAGLPETSPHRTEIVMYRKDSTPVCVDVVAVALRGEQGQITGYMSINRDIGERKRAEEERRQSEERFRAQYKGFPIPTFSWRKVEDDFELVDYNEAADKITRGGLTGLLGMRASEWYADKPQMLEMLGRCFSEGTTIQQEVPWQMVTTGEHKHFAVTFAPVPPDLVMHHAEDITKRKQAEETLEESHALLRSVIEGPPDAIYLKDAQGRYLMANASAAKILGKSVQELLGNDNTEFMPIGVARRIAEIDRQIIDTEESQVGEEHLRVEGTTRTYHFIKAPYRDHHGKVAGVVGIARDITERKETEEALRLRAELLDLSYEPIFAWELDGDIVYWNRGAEELYGFSKIGRAHV